MLPPTLSNIKPLYEARVKYSKPGEPVQEIADGQHLNESAFAADEPTRPVNLEHNTKWAKELRHAAEAR